MAADKEARFTDLVVSEFSTDQHGARTLWTPLAHQFDDGDGPEAVREYLEAQRQQLVDRVKKLLGQVEERIDD